MTDIRYTFTKGFGNVGSTSAYGAWNANFVTWDNTGFGTAISRRPGYNDNYHGPNADKWKIGGVYAYATGNTDYLGQPTYAFELVFFRTSTSVTESPLASGDQIKFMNRILTVGSHLQGHSSFNAYSTWAATGGVFGGYIHRWEQNLFGFGFSFSDVASIYFTLANTPGQLTTAQSLYLPDNPVDRTEESYTNLFAGTSASPSIVEPNQYYYATFANTAPTTTQGSGLTLSNINGSVSVQPGFNAQISLNGGSTYTTGTLTAQPNDTVHFRTLSPNTFSTTLVTSLSIGTITHSGTIKTRDAADITPSGFNLGPNTVTGTQPGLQYNAPMTATGSWSPVNQGNYTVAGVEGSVTATPTNGQIAVNPSGTPNFVSSPVSVVNGDIIRFRFTASSDFSTTTTHSLQIGDVTDTVTCTTTSNPSINPVLTVEYEDISGGFKLKSNPAGGAGTHTFEWSTAGGGKNSKPAYNNGFQSASHFDIGSEWQGTTWRVRVRTVNQGQTVTSLYTTVLLPTFVITIPQDAVAQINEGNSVTARVTHTGANTNSQLYWNFLTQFGTDFNPMSGTVTVSGTGTTDFTSFAITDNIAETIDAQTLELYNHSSKAFFSNTLPGNLVSNVSFDLNDTFEQPHLGIALSTDSEPDKLLTVSGSNTTITLSNMSGTGGNHTYMITDNAPTSTFALLSELNILTTITNFSPTQSANFTINNPNENSGKVYYVWARLTSTTNSSARVWNTGKYFVLSNPDRAIGWQTPSVTIAGDNDDDVTVAVTNFGSLCQYKVVCTQTGRWCDTASNHNDFVATFEYTTTAGGVESNIRELPPTPDPGSGDEETYSYEVFVRLRSTAIPGFPSTGYAGGNDDHWVEVTQAQQLTITRTDDADVDPDMPTFNTQFNATPGAYYFKEFTTTGVTNPITWNISGGTISSSQPTSSTSTTSLQRDENETAFIQVQAPSQTGQSATGTLSYTGGTETSTFTVTTAAAPDGNPVSGSGATGFGLEIFNENGSQVIFGTSHSSAGYIADGTFSVPAATTVSTGRINPGIRTYPETGTIAELVGATANEVEIVLVLDNSESSDTFNQLNTFSSNYIKNGDGTFTIRNSTTLNAISGTYIVIRS